MQTKQITEEKKPSDYLKIIVLALIVVFSLSAYQLYKNGACINSMELKDFFSIQFTCSPVDSIPVVSRDFFIGRWQVQQMNSMVSGETDINYLEDGTFNGKMSGFVNSQGGQVLTNGTWNFDKLSDNKFRLKLWINYPQSGQWEGTFKIINRNHIHNIDQNYIAIRVDD
jgi:hypothetical protein